MTNEAQAKTAEATTEVVQTKEEKTSNFYYIFTVLMYLLIGYVVGLMFSDYISAEISETSWGNIWSYFWVFLWPLGLLYKLGLYGIGIIVCLAVGGVIGFHIGKSDRAFDLKYRKKGREEEKE